MSPIELFIYFLLIIWPSFNGPAIMSSSFSLDPTPALLAMLHEHQIQAAVMQIYALKCLFPHHFREYHSPFYVKPRPKDLWLQYMQHAWTDETFRESFRMDRRHFSDLCDRLRPYLEGGHTNYKETLSVEIKVAIGLYRFASAHVAYRTLRDIFGVGSCPRL
jgi:hypothetical protein